MMTTTQLTAWGSALRGGRDPRGGEVAVAESIDTTINLRGRGRQTGIRSPVSYSCRPARHNTRPSRTGFFLAGMLLPHI